MARSYGRWVSAEQLTALRILCGDSNTMRETGRIGRIDPAGRMSQSESRLGRAPRDDVSVVGGSIRVRGTSGRKDFSFVRLVQA